MEEETLQKCSGSLHHVDLDPDRDTSSLSLFYISHLDMVEY
jgi:hypothetical protein